MNRQELRIQVRRILAEAGTAKWTDDSINDQLNRSARAIAQERALLKRRVQLSSVDGAVTLPADAVGVRGVWANAGRYHLRAVQPTEAPLPGEYMGSLVETYSFDPAWGNTLSVYPARSVALTVDILSAGDPMTTDGMQPWGGAWEAYHHAIAWHAAHHLGGQAGASGAKESAFYQRYQLVMQEFAQAVAMQALGTPDMRVAGVSPALRRRRW